MRPYEVYMHLDLLGAVPKSGTQRRKIMNFIRSLSGHPDTTGDFTDKDTSSRLRQIKIIGDYYILSGRAGAGGNGCGCQTG